jgi:acetate kinase
MSDPSYVLVVNAGSSSLKYSLVDGETGDAPADGTVERIGESSGRLEHVVASERSSEKHTQERAFADHEQALQAALDAFDAHGPSLADAHVVGVGHRVVHGGARFSMPTLIDDEVVAAIEALVPLAPLHNPANLEGIAVARKLFPDLPQVAVFDTAFHQTMPPVAYTYAVPRTWLVDHDVRRYGFHGTSHAYVARTAAAALGRPVEDLNVIVLHLGNGASATAVRGGVSVDTSMGLTPLEGLVMGTRSGDLDPAVHMHLHRSLGWSLEEIDRVLNRESGLKGLAGANDFREVMRLRADGDEAAALAFDVYCYRIRKYVGAYCAVLGTVDAVAFTAGVGEHSPELRAAALSDLTQLGIEVDPARNAAPGSGATVVSSDSSAVAVLVVPTDEEYEIARQTLAVVRG